MKLWATADWHLGKILHGVDLSPHQEEVLHTLLDLAEEERPDALLIAGDVFDSLRPSGEALKVFTRVMDRIRALGIPAYLIAGNHDMPEMVAHLRPLLNQVRIHPFGAAEVQEVLAREVPLKELLVNLDQDRYLLPLPHLPRYVLRTFSSRFAGEDGETPLMTGFLIWLVENLPVPPERTLLLAHIHVGRGEDPGETVGLVEKVAEEALRGWGLVITGHLHRAHEALPRVWYPGSILPYHPHESDHTKAFLEIEWDHDVPRVRERSLPQPVTYWTVQGRLEGGRFVRTGGDDPPEHARLVFVRARLEGGPVDRSLPDVILDSVREDLNGTDLRWAGFEGPVFSGEGSGGGEAVSVPRGTPLEMVLAYLEERGVWSAWPEEMRTRIQNLLEEILQEVEA